MSNLNIFQRLLYIYIVLKLTRANELIKLSSAEVMAVGDAFCSRFQSIPVDLINSFNNLSVNKSYHQAMAGCVKL